MKHDEYVRSTTRARRYRDAGKTFRFGVYMALEIYVLLAIVVGLLAAWLATGWIGSISTAMFLIAPVAIVLHHATLALSKPWILLARIAEAGLATAFVVALEWLLEHDLPAWELGVCVFVVRYWEVGEREINALAYQNSQHTKGGAGP